MNLGAVSSIAARLDGCALIGAYALAARGYVRQTTDIDLLSTDRKALHPETWGDFTASDFRVEIRKGDDDDPLAGVVRSRSSETLIDLVVGKEKWQTDLIDRAEVMRVGDISLRVPKTTGLILLKLFAGGHADLYDVARLLEIGVSDTVMAEMDAALEGMPASMHNAWERVIARR